MNIDLACRQILMSAYLYYHRSESVLSDAENDELIKFVVNNWRDVPERYLPLLDPNKDGSSALAATSSHCKYTRLVEGGAISWLKKMTGKELEPLGSGYAEINEDININDLF